MVDFRYHLISIVAVFLALGIGILLGSGLLGERLVKGLEGEVKDVRDTNDRLQQVIDDQDSRLRDLEQGFDVARPWIVAGVLQDEQVVVLTFQGTDGDVLDGVRAAVDDAGGSVSSTIALREELALQDDADRDELVRILGVGIDGNGAPDVDVVRAIGALVAGAGLPGSEKTTEEGVDLDQDAGQVFSDLQRAGFVDLDADDEEQPVPIGADFMIVGGSTQRPGFDPAQFTLSLTAGLTDERAVVLVAEPVDSAWGVVDAVREDPRLSAEVATVDHADATVGEIASVLALDEAGNGSPGDYGWGDGAVAPLPDNAAAD